MSNNTTTNHATMAALVAEFDMQRAAKTAPQNTRLASSHHRELGSVDASGLLRMVVGAVLIGLVLALAVAL